MLTAISQVVWNSIYPGGPNTTPANGYATKVYPGWPVPDDIDADMAATPPVVNISVFNEDLEKNTTRYPREVKDNVRGTPRISAVVTSETVTLGGTIQANDYVSLILFNVAVSYKVLGTDTLTTVAASLTALAVAAGLTATSSGFTITLPDAAVSDIIFRIGAPGTTLIETRRQQKRVMITVWAPTQAVRDTTAAIADAALALIAPPMTAADFLSFPDGSSGWLLYDKSSNVDRFETKTIQCRDLCYWCEYPTTQPGVGYPLTVWSVRITNSNSGNAYTVNG